jgi:hypothetical protein
VVDPPPGTGGDPSITLGATAVGLGATVTATMIDGPGSQYDWMVLVPVGAPSSSWSKMVFVPPYQTSMEWNVEMPTTAGDYEIRLLEDGTYNVLATSETITVGDVTEPPPGTGGDPGISISATTVGLGATVTAMMTDSPGNQFDWMVLVPAGASSRKWLKMTFVPQYQTWMNWNVSMPATPGDYEIRLLKDGSYKVLATSPTITVTQ